MCEQCDQLTGHQVTLKSGPYAGQVGTLMERARVSEQPAWWVRFDNGDQRKVYVSEIEEDLS